MFSIRASAVELNKILSDIRIDSDDTAMYNFLEKWNILYLQKVIVNNRLNGNSLYQFFCSDRILIAISSLLLGYPLFSLFPETFGMIFGFNYNQRPKLNKKKLIKLLEQKLGL